LQIAKIWERKGEEEEKKKLNLNPNPKLSKTLIDNQ
jgi:hypothetical protein